MDQNNPHEEYLTLFPEDLNIICRSCLNKNGSINLFQTEYEGVLLCDLLTVFCKVDPEESDGFPQNICNNCADFITQCYIFKEEVQRSYITLEALVNENSCIKKKTQTESKEKSKSIHSKTNCSGDTLEIEDMLNVIIKEEEPLIVDECYTDNSEFSICEIKEDFETTLIETDFNNLSENTLTCSFCKLMFTSEPIYKLHMDKENEIRKEETCKVCDQLVSKPKFKKHIQEHAKNNEIVCKICNKSFSHHWHLSKHLSKHLKKTKEQCHVCGKTISKLFIEDHIRNHFGEKNIPCDICDEKFITNRELMRHKHEHKLATGEIQPKECKICGKKLKTGIRLSRHMEKHKLKTLCNECGKEFTFRNNLTRHIQNVHRKVKPFVCQICNTPFSQKSSLKDHMNVHTGEKPHLCSECGKTFRQRNYLKLHLNSVHRPRLDSDGKRSKTDVHKNVTCEYCDKKFELPHHLRMHMPQHSKRPYSCHLCYKTFKQNNSLQVHLQYHKDSQLYCCDLCPKTCISLVALKLHRAKKHTHRQTYYKEKKEAVNDLEKSYVCPFCPRKFMYVWNLRKHVKVHEKENHFSCDICFETFSDSEKVELHKTNKHETENVDDFSDFSVDTNSS